MTRTCEHCKEAPVERRICLTDADGIVLDEIETCLTCIACVTTVGPNYDSLDI